MMPMSSVPFDQAPHQVFLEADLAADGNVRRRGAHAPHPLRQQPLPQRDARADRDAGAEAARQPDIVPRLLERQHQRFRVPQKALAGGRQAGAGAVAHEQLVAEISFQTLYAGAHCDWVTCSRLAASRKLRWPPPRETSEPDLCP